MTVLSSIVIPNACEGSPVQKNLRKRTDRPRRKWTDAQRAAQAAKCRAQKPWAHATGPRTASGKSISSGNAYRHGYRSVPYRRFCAVLAAQKAYVRTLLATQKKPHPPLFKGPKTAKVFPELKPTIGKNDNASTTRPHLCYRSFTDEYCIRAG